MKRLRYVLGWGCLCTLSLVMFKTLFYYARHYWGLTLLDSRLVAAQEPNRVVLVMELVSLGLVVAWSSLEFILEIRRLGRKL